ncbi:hypothetical protein [Mesomycoplasma ovipneumoniae]|uniref:hypothetical protein n=1 Tax=Mesomycoplasma ovipneumoniae TaxID=29562 RepID=UPI0028A7E31C|nr:hypothetical protein [Mesomycoplasma ovipneumoniae]WNM16202.1 hypothetical protein RNM19_02430 [Mesomycoplasma ovipneumoniae]
MLQKLRQRVEFNTLDQQMIFKNRDVIPSGPNIWNRYDFYFDILIKSLIKIVINFYQKNLKKSLKTGCFLKLPYETGKLGIY